MPSEVIDVDIATHYRLGLDRPILEGIRWSVSAGEHWVVLGANGAGKSTLLSIIAGDPWPSRGVVRVLGQEYGRVDKRELKKHIGVVSAHLFEAFPASDTALEVAASGLDARIGRFGALSPEESAKALAALSAVNALDTAPKRYGVLSQGERQRVMIARALIASPALLVLDEPCAGLDPAARERFLRDLGELAAGAAAPTQILITHHLEEVPAYVTHGLLLREGRALAQGPIEEVFTSDLLSRTFDTHCRVEPRATDRGRRWSLTVL